MTRAACIFVLLLACAALHANDIAVSAPDGRSGWLLLENPYGSTGPGLSEFAGDPGMPVPDALGWPHNGDANGRYPETELWHFKDGRYTLATHVLGKGNRGDAFRRTLYAVFTIAGAPYVLHYDPYQTLKGYTQVLRVDASTGEGEVPAAAIALNSPDFLDAPAVSPDGRHVAFRAFKLVGRAYQCHLRVYETAGWSQVAESPQLTLARPVWLGNDTLAAIVWDADKAPDAPQTRRDMLAADSHQPAPGRVMRFELGDALAGSEILKGEFPPDRYTLTLAADPVGLGLVLARADAGKIVIEQREATPDGRVFELTRVDAFRGLAVSLDRIRVAGVAGTGAGRRLAIVDRLRWGEMFVPKPGGGFRIMPVPGDTRGFTGTIELPEFSSDGHGGLLDLGRGVIALLEPVVNPDHERAGAQLLRHTLVVPAWPGCDTMRNPRVVQRLSRMVSRFTEVGSVRTSLLAFDVEIEANQGQNKKSGRYIELYGNSGRGGQGRIRTEDNLGGDWIVQAIDGGGTRATDDYYSCAGEAEAMKKQTAFNAGKAYDDLVTQLGARRLLTLTGAERDADGGGLVFVRRGTHQDPYTKATWRTWVFVKYGQLLENGDRERLVLQFVAGMPVGTAGNWAFPHALAQVQMRFALANQQEAAVTELSFEPGSWVELPNLVDASRPKLLLPKVFRIYEGDTLRLRAVAVDKAFNHPAAFARSGRIEPGYEVPLAGVGNRQFVQKQR